jgi:hypothetical protein
MIKNEKDLKNAARRLASKTGQPHTQALENLCIALFNRSWAEVKITKPFQTREVGEAPSGQIHILLEEKGAFWDGDKFGDISEARPLTVRQYRDDQFPGTPKMFRITHSPVVNTHHTAIRSNQKYGHQTNMFWNSHTEQWVEGLQQGCINPKNEPPCELEESGNEWEIVHMFPFQGKVTETRVELEHYHAQIENDQDFAIQELVESVWISYGPFTFMFTEAKNKGIEVNACCRGNEEITIQSMYLPFEEPK